MKKSLKSLILNDWFLTYFILIVCAIFYVLGHTDIFLIGALYIIVYNLDHLFSYLNYEERARMALLELILLVTLVIVMFIGMNIIK